jgi:hypothetical protein
MLQVYQIIFIHNNLKSLESVIKVKINKKEFRIKTPQGHPQMNWRKIMS